VRRDSSFFYYGGLAVWPQNGQENRPKELTRPHFLQTTWPVCGVVIEFAWGRGRGSGSGIMTPIKHVIIPVTNKAPPAMKTGRSLAQAKTLPESIVSRQELAAAAVRTGPMTTIIIPRMKMSDLNSSQDRCRAPFRGDVEGLGGFLSLCY
jgi:hypothetical protein